MRAFECRGRRAYRTGIGVLSGLALFGALAMPARAGVLDGCPGCPALRAEPWVFVGQPEHGCDPAGANIVTSAWLCGMGLPDNGEDNFNLLAPNDLPAKQDPRLGLLLSKNGHTTVCASAGATILGVENLPPTGMFTEIGFDNRNGTHCSGGATRFNVVVCDPTCQMGLGPETSHFVGSCSNDIVTGPTPAPQDPLEWTRVRFTLSNPLETFPLIPVGSRILGIDLLFDEGTDTVGVVEDPRGVGLAVVDNIFIVDTFIRSGTGVAPACDDADKDGLCDEVVK